MKCERLDMLFLSLLRFFQTFLKVNIVFIGLYENIAFGHFYINGFVDLKAYCTSQLYIVMVIFLYGNPHRKLSNILVTFYICLCSNIRKKWITLSNAKSYNVTMYYLSISHPLLKMIICQEM